MLSHNIECEYHVFEQKNFFGCHILGLQKSGIQEKSGKLTSLLQGQTAQIEI